MDAGPALANIYARIAIPASTAATTAAGCAAIRQKIPATTSLNQ